MSFRTALRVIPRGTRAENRAWAVDWPSIIVSILVQFLFHISSEQYFEHLLLPSIDKLVREVQILGLHSATWPSRQN